MTNAELADEIDGGYLRLSKIRDDTHSEYELSPDQCQQIIAALRQPSSELAQAQVRIAELEAGMTEIDTRDALRIEKDAARYRWLRKYCKTPSDRRSIILLGDTLDEAIDAALSVPTAATRSATR